VSATVHRTDANDESTNSRTKCLANGLRSTVLKQFLANKQSNKLQPQIAVQSFMSCQSLRYHGTKSHMYKLVIRK